MKLHGTTLTGSRDGPHLLISGGVHGDEFEPIAAIRQLARLLQSTSISGQITMVPVVNGPAFQRGDRTAEDSLDLARTCPGRPDGSITERIAHALSKLIRKADLYVDLHSGGAAMRILPLVGYMLHADSEVLERQRRMARAFNLPIIWGTTAALDGRSLSVARDANVPAIYAEWGGGGGCDPHAVADYVNGCLNLMAEFGMLDRRQDSPVPQLVVEDDRQQSGHLQVCYPSPMSGLFESCATLGQKVARGDTLGRVSDDLDARVVAVESTQDGIVICLRAFCRVSSGDSLAVILETGTS